VAPPLVGPDAEVPQRRPKWRLSQLSTSTYLGGSSGLLAHSFDETYGTRDFMIGRTFVLMQPLRKTCKIPARGISR
jgi:hypothetical protein